MKKQKRSLLLSATLWASEINRWLRGSYPLPRWESFCGPFPPRLKNFFFLLTVNLWKFQMKWATLHHTRGSRITQIGRKLQKNKQTCGLACAQVWRSFNQTCSSLAEQISNDMDQGPKKLGNNQIIHYRNPTLPALLRVNK